MALDVAEACELDVVSNDRALRRRAVIRGIHVRETTVASCVSALSLVGRDIADTLDGVDDAVLELPPGDVAILIGSAAALSDELAGPMRPSRKGASCQQSRCRGASSAGTAARGAPTEPGRVGRVGGAQAQQPWVADLGAVEHIELTDVAADVAGALTQTEDRAFRSRAGPSCRACLLGRPWCPGEYGQCSCAGMMKQNMWRECTGQHW